MKETDVKIVLVGGDQDDYERYGDLLVGRDSDNKRFHLTWSKNYEESLGYSLKNQPHVFLVDFRLGDRTAVDFITDVRKNNCTKPIILLIEASDYASRRAAKEAGAEFCLKIPFEDAEQLSDTILDSIERFEALEAIRKSERRMRGIFYWSSIGIVMLNMDRQIVQNNPAFCRIVGYNNEQLCALDIADDFSDSPHVTQIRESFQKIADQKLQVSQIESQFQRKDGRWIWVELTLSLFSENSSNPQYVICLLQDINEKKKTQFALEASEIQLRDLSVHLIDIKENEQRRLSFELHDSVGGNLAGIKYMIERLKIMAEKQADSFVESLTKIERQVIETMEEVKRLSSNLHPVMLEELGLEAALHWLCRKHNEIYTEIDTTFNTDIDESRIPQTLRMTIFRLAQEAMNNAAKHSRGNQIQVTLMDQKDSVTLSVIDNGTGFDSKPLRDLQDPKGLGLRSMIKRTELSGGRLQILPKKGEGTRVVAEWPL